MPWLVQPQLSAARKPECCRQTPPLFDDAFGELDALALQLLHGGVHVIAHQIQLMMRTLGRRVRRQLSGRKSEDEPPSPSIDVRKLERVA